MRGWIALLPLALLTAAGPPAKPAFRMSWPVDCRLGQTCAIQNYVDDPGVAVRDYACRGRTYPGHDGVDIRLVSMALERRGVNVLAVASGQVLRVRDGVEDRSVGDAPPGAVAGQECGNGVVIAHREGWETQYCHMRRGSVAVHPGDEVKAGAVLGQVGLSGDTEFPHLHLTVRKNGQAVDPFAFAAPAGSCRAGQSLWQQTPAYREGEVQVAGFAAGPVQMRDVQDHGADVQRLILIGPDGSALADNKAPPLDHDKAQQLLFAGRGRVPAGGWPAGEYRATYSVTRKGKTVLTNFAKIRI